MKWYEYNIKERYEKVYKSFSIEDFWKWWSDDEESVMEVRIKDFNKIKEFSLKYKMPMSASGLYVKSGKQLKFVVDYFGNNTTMWFGINPKKRILNKYGKSRFSGLDVAITKIKFLFIDIDRVVKNGKATNSELSKADFLAEKVLEELGKNGFSNNYVKICSGNGTQILIKLDVPIEMPEAEYSQETSTYIEDAFFLKTKNVFKEGIGKILVSFSKKFAEEYNVEIDKTCFNIGRVGALHGSFNFKYDIPIPRGIVELKDEGKNEDFSDYLMDIHTSSVKQQELKKSFNKNTKAVLLKEYKLVENNLSQNVLINLMLTHTFPDGGINNTLWYGIKLLLHNKGITNIDTEYINIRSKLMAIHNRDFAQNGLEEQYKNNDNGPLKLTDINIVANMVNKYLRLHKIKRLDNGKEGYHKPIFPVKQGYKEKNKIRLRISPSLLKENNCGNYNISEQRDDPLKDLSDFSFSLNNIRRGDTIAEEHCEGEYNFTPVGEVLVFKELTEKLMDFSRSFFNKWGQEIIIYMMKNYFDDYINYR